MKRLMAVMILAGGCLPTSSEVTQYQDSMEQALARRCDDDVPIGPDWCTAIDGRCYPQRVAPDQEPAEGTDSTRHGSTSMCLVECFNDSDCALHHECRQAQVDDDTVLKTCFRKSLCRSSADCGEGKFGGHIFDSKCEDFGGYVCRFQRQSGCDRDSECVDRHGAGALCIQSYCELDVDEPAACETSQLFSKRCAHNPQAVAASVDPLAHLSRVQLGEPCDDEGLCDFGDGPGTGICANLSGVQRCWPRHVDGECPVGWERKNVSRSLEIPNATVCVPMIPCVPNGRTYGPEHLRGSCVGIGDGTCPDVGTRLVANQERCGDNAAECPDGSGCFLGVCIVTDESLISSWQMTSINACRLDR